MSGEGEDKREDVSRKGDDRESDVRKITMSKESVALRK